MGVFRVNKTKNYTVMSNHHLSNKSLSLKAKGLLSQMLSLPDDWDYSISGLVSINRENKTAIQGALKELEECGYLKRTKVHGERGRIDYIYDIYENPWTEEPRPENLCTVNPCTVNPCTENQPQLSTNLQNTKQQSTKRQSTKEVRHKHGEYQNVLLSDTDLAKLKAEFPADWQERIERLSAYMASTGKSYKNHLATIRNWARMDAKRNGNSYGNGYGNNQKKEVEIDEQYVGLF